MVPEVKLEQRPASQAGPSGGPGATPPLSTRVAAKPAADGGAQLWVEKYKPKGSRELVGNIGCIDWLRCFLDNWCAAALYGYVAKGPVGLCASCTQWLHTFDLIGFRNIAGEGI